MNSQLHKLLIEGMQDLYDAEKQLVKALPKMIKAASNEDFRQGLTDHLGETEEQVGRLEQAFELLDAKAKSKPCAGMKGIVEEARETIESGLEDAILDVALIAGARHAEHYEMAGYESAISWASQMGHDDVVALLEASLAEEIAADDKLNSLNADLIQDLEGSQEGTEQPVKIAPATAVGKTSKARAGSGGGKH